MKIRFYLACFFLFCSYAFYAVWTYTQTDPNLVISQWEPFWQFQQWVWHIPDHLVTKMYIGLILSSLLFYVSIIWFSVHLQLNIHKILFILGITTLPLFFSNNALSHDVFNYMFNALMVVKYGANPHVKTALDFSFEPWTRFMHNVHTPAPYFYGWTALSIVPYLLGLKTFVLTWFMFRLWSGIGFFATLFFVWKLMKEDKKADIRSFFILAFSPLLAIELISNAHNDGWMMWPAVASLYVLKKSKSSQHRILHILGSFSLLALSISTKYVTIVLLPVWLFVLLQHFISSRMMFQKFQDKLGKYFSLSDLSALLLFLPLLTARSKFFLPWYISWPFSFYPLMKNNTLKNVLLILSISPLFRYIPWLWNGGFAYTAEIERQERLIIWIPLLLMILLFAKNVFTRKK